MKPSDFFTKTSSNKGAKMYLKDPLTGEDTNQFLHVLGLESDAFEAALTEKRKRSQAIATMPEDEQAAAEVDSELCLYASLVVEWSFEEPFSADGVKELIKEAPQIRLAIDKFASKIANFIKRQSKN